MYLLLRYGILKVPVNSADSAEFTGAGKYPFFMDVCGSMELGIFGRGKNSEIGSYLNKITLSEISCNIIDLCPVKYAKTLKCQ